MASAIIHLCVAKKINEKLKLNEKEFLLGAIAPDISKQIGLTKNKSHFLTTPKDQVPNIKEFLDKYKSSLNKPFNLGYFVHLYTDKIWFDEFINTLVLENNVKLLDGTTLKTSKEEILHLIYNDYTNLNIKLIDKFNLDLSLFYEDFNIPDTNITEIPKEKLNLLLEKMAFIIMESKQKKAYIFNMEVIVDFINYSVDKILKKIEQYDIKVHV